LNKFSIAERTCSQGSFLKNPGTGQSFDVQQTFDSGDEE
jgi:hypothetical protein